nr:hypothetical protein [Streptomyces sp. MH191]
MAPRVRGLQRYRGPPQRLVGRPRQREPELRAAARFAPGLQPAPVQPGVLQGDRQPETGAAGGARACRVRPPEAAEHPGRLPRLESHPVVAHRHRHRAARGGQLHEDVAPLTVLHGVDDQVAQHALHAPGVGLGHDGLLVAHDPYSGSLALGERFGPADHPPHDLAQVDRLGLQRRRARVEPADLQQVGEQCLEAVELVGEEFRRPCGHRVEVHPGVVDDVGRHPHGGQRGAQLVRDVRDEPPLHPRQVLELLDLELQVLRHLVEGLAQAGDVVLAGDLHAFLQASRGQPLGDPGRHPHRGDDLAHDEPGDRPEQDDDEQSRRRQRALDQAERLLLLREREEVVQLVGVAVGVVDLPADDQSGLRLALALGVDDAGVALHRPGARVDPLAQALGHAQAPVDAAGGARAEAAPLVVRGGGAQRDDVEGALAAAGERLHEVAEPPADVLHGVAVAVAPAGGGGAVVPTSARRAVGPLAGHREPAGRLALGGLHLGVQEPVAHLADDDEAEQQHHSERHQQRRGDDLELDVAAPQAHHRQQRPPYPAHQEPQHGTALHTALQQAALEQACPAGFLRPHAVDSPLRADPGPAGRRSGTVLGHVSSVLPCIRHHGPSPRSPASPGPSRPWSAAAGRAR